jgi:hypothetical protein
MYSRIDYVHNVLVCYLLPPNLQSSYKKIRLTVRTTKLVYYSRVEVFGFDEHEIDSE